MHPSLPPCLCLQLFGRAVRFGGLLVGPAPGAHVTEQLLRLPVASLYKRSTGAAAMEGTELLQTPASVQTSEFRPRTESFRRELERERKREGFLSSTPAYGGAARMVSAAARVMKAAAPWVLACGFLLCLAGSPGEFSRRFSSPALSLRFVSPVHYGDRSPCTFFSSVMVLLLLALSDCVFVNETVHLHFFPSA